MSGNGSTTNNASYQMGSAADRQVKIGEDWLAFSKEQFKLSNDRLTELDALIKSNDELYTRLAQEQADFTKTQTDKQLAYGDEVLGLGRQVAQKQMETANWQSDTARADRERYETVYRPIEDQYIQDASNYGSEQNQAEAAASAIADVRTQAAASKGAAQREAMSYGIRPDSGRFQGLTQAADLGTALAAAGAANNARTTTADKGLALRGELAGFGLNVNQQAQAGAQAATASQNSSLAALAGGASQATGASNSAIANRGTAADGQIAALNTNANNKLNLQNSFLSSAGIVGQGYSGLSSGLSAATGIWSNQLQRQDNNNSAMLGAIGTGVGLMLSDEDEKVEKKGIPEGEALEAVKNMPVEEWRYAEEHGDDATHVGTYAQDFQRETGKGDGRSIPVVDAIGITMKAVQDLAGDVDKIKLAVGLGGKKKPSKAPGIGQQVLA